MSESLIQDVSDTAFMVAVYRALESERPDPLFRDPLARTLAGDRGKRIVESLPKKAFMGGWSVVIRTHVIDRFIQSAISEGVDTILNLGAGLDTRPYRMDLPSSLRWIEVDYPHVIEFKEERLFGEKPHCRLDRVKLDLADTSARQGFLAETAAQSKKILVLTEGVVPYLSPEEVASLAEDLRSNSVFRYWLVDYFSPESYRYRRRKGMTQAMKNAPFRFEPEDYYGFFARHGWSSKEVRYLAEESDRLHRSIPLPGILGLWLRLMKPFMSSERRAALKRFTGYVLFEPSGSK